jgi:hypothetical protein
MIKSLLPCIHTAIVLPMDADRMKASVLADILINVEDIGMILVSHITNDVALRINDFCLIN